MYWFYFLPAINSPWMGEAKNVLIYFSITTQSFSHSHSFPSLIFLSTGRYYRANSVRFPTQPCEGVCSLNHYCAITRIDYREYRQCLETAASALASSRSNTGDMNNKILLLLITLIQLLLHQQFVATQIFLSAVQVKLSIVNGFKTLVSPFKLIHLHSQQVC